MSETEAARAAEDIMEAITCVLSQRGKAQMDLLKHTLKRRLCVTTNVIQRLLDEKDAEHETTDVHCEQLEELCNRLCDEKEKMRAEIERLKQALVHATDSIAWNKYVESVPSKLGGIPLVKGTRFAVSQLFIELANCYSSIEDIADNYNVDIDQLSGIMRALSIYFDQPKQLADATDQVEGGD